MNWGPCSIHTYPILFISFIYPYVWAGPNFSCNERTILSNDIKIQAFRFYFFFTKTYKPVVEWLEGLQ